MPSIETLKKFAKKLKKAKTISHYEALNQIAKEQGFNSWSLLVRSKTGISYDNLLDFKLIAEESSIDNEYKLSKIQGPYYRVHLKDLMKELIGAFKSQSLKAFHNKYTSIEETLVIDGFHHLQSKRATQEEISTIIRKRKYPTVGLSLEPERFYNDPQNGIISDVRDLLFSK